MIVMQYILFWYDDSQRYIGHQSRGVRTPQLNDTQTSSRLHGQIKRLLNLGKEQTLVARLLTRLSAPAVLDNAA